jgi:hypothetical protein
MPKLTKIAATRSLGRYGKSGDGFDLSHTRPSPAKPTYHGIRYYDKWITDGIPIERARCPPWSKAQSIANATRSSDGLAAPSTAPNMAINVSGWLQELGLERYEEAFRDNDVDGDVLPDLTAEDPIGHRPKLLAAIAAIGPDVSAVAVATTPAPTLTSAPAAEPASSRAAPLSPWQ